MSAPGIFHNGQSAQQFNCTLSLADGHLHLFFENNDLLIWDLKKLHSCHLNGNHLIIKNGNFPHQTLECTGEIAFAIYNAWSHKNIIRQAEGFTFRKARTTMIVFVVLFIGLGIFTFFFFLPWAGEKAAILVPKEAEIELGESIEHIYAQESDINDSATYYLNKFVQHLDLDDTYEIQTKVINSDQINAFALPGGKIFVYSGIIDKMESYEELVALLGHEVTHVVNRHSLKSICRSAATSIVIASLFGDVTGISSGILSQAEQFKQLDYSRSLETEADDNGLEIMIQNKVDPKGMLDLLKLLKEEGSEMPQLMKYLSTHPDTDSRITNITQNPEMKKVFFKNEKLENLFTSIKRVL